jgi:hypothetical protein
VIARKYVSFFSLLVLLVVIGGVIGCAGPTPTPPPAAAPVSTPTGVAAPTPTDAPPPLPTDTPALAPTPAPASTTSTPPAEPFLPPPPIGGGIVVDNTDPDFTVEAGEWGTCQDGDCSGTCYGADFRYADPECTTCRARFDFTVETAGEYDVWTWWPWGEDRATDTPFTFVYSGGPFTINIDQRNSGDDWYWLATLAFEAGESASIVVEGTATGYANADAVALTPLGSEPAGPPAAGEPAVQYYYAEESYTAGCYYLHWDASEAAAVYLNDEAVDNPGSTEVCPEESTVYVLRAENEAGSVEQALTVDVAAPPPPVPPTPTEQSIVPPTTLPPVACFRRVIFLHHSCGANLIEQGNVRQRLTAPGYEFYDHGYNGDGLVLADGTWTGRNFDVPDDNTNPDGFAVIFAQPLHDPPDNTFSHLMQYDVIAFKSCFPVSHIESDGQLAEYKSYYLSIRDRMDQYPNKIFIVVTQPPEIPNDTDAAAAARARAFTNWLASDEYLSGHPNVFTFNFFDLLADPGNHMLRVEYRVDEYDAHPNELANRTIGPLFVDFIDRAIRAYGGG